MIFTVQGKPQGKARARTFYNPRLGRSQSVTPEKTVLYENLIKTCYQSAEDKKQWMNKEPLMMNIKAYFEIPKSTSKKNRKLMEDMNLRPTKKPDADNIAKVVCDALNGIAYYDDAQIVTLNIVKVYTDANPKVVVDIQEIMPEAG